MIGELVGLKIRDYDIEARPSARRMEGRASHVALPSCRGRPVN